MDVVKYIVFIKFILILFLLLIGCSNQLNICQRDLENRNKEVYDLLQSEEYLQNKAAADSDLAIERKKIDLHI